MATTVSKVNSCAFRSFLRNLKVSLTSETLSTNSFINFVIGNEAADADSIVSALCYSYLKNRINLIETSKNFGFVPVVCVNREDLRLRGDVSLLLNMVGIDLMDIFCKDDSVIANYDPSKDFNMVLVDHNSISPSCSLSRFEQYVNEIIDHHSDARKLSWVQGNYRNIAFDEVNGVATVGSSCTIIAEKYLESNNPLLDIDIATILLAVIDIDTLQMSAEYGKGTVRDQRVIDQLLERFPSIDRDNIHQAIKNAKTDPLFWHKLPARDCLRLDYKQSHCANSKVNFGVSSVIINVNDLCNKLDFKTALIAYFDPCEEGNKLHFLAIMSILPGTTPTRELAIASTSRSLLDSVAMQLQKDEHSLELEENSVPSSIIPSLHTSNGEFDIYLRCFSQKNIRASRKQLMPILSALLDDRSYL